MQETKVTNDKFPVGEFADTGYHIVFKEIAKNCGVSIALKHKPQKVVFGLDDEPFNSERMITVIFDDFVIIITYVPQGHKRDSAQYAYKLAWFGRFKKYLKKIF
jgi:exodeoxyribonuclease-3